MTDKMTTQAIRTDKDVVTPELILKTLPNNITPGQRTTAFNALLNSIRSTNDKLEQIIYKASVMALDDWHESGQIGKVNRLYWRLGSEEMMSAFKNWVIRHTGGNIAFSAWAEKSQSEHFKLIDGMSADDLPVFDNERMVRMQERYAEENPEKAEKLNVATMDEILKSPQQYLPVFVNVASEGARAKIDPSGHWRSVKARLTPPIRSFIEEDTAVKKARKVTRTKRRSSKQEFEAAIVQVPGGKRFPDEGMQQAFYDSVMSDAADALLAMLPKGTKESIVCTDEQAKSELKRALSNMFKPLPEPPMVAEDSEEAENTLANLNENVNVEDAN